jgi:molecular chaperone GrpE
VPKRKNKGGRNRERDDEESSFRDLNEETMDIESVPETGGEVEFKKPSKAEVEHALRAEEEITRLNARVKELEAQVEKEKNEQLYIRAEFDTHRRRAIKERSDSLKYAGERSFKELLGVLDNFERALAVEVKAESLESFRNGVKLIADEIKNVLKREGVEEVPPKNDTFDPNIFEAISSEETDEKTPGAITTVFRKAYKLHDRIIRHGQVAVARPPTNKPKEETNEDEGWEIVDEN